MAASSVEASSVEASSRGGEASLEQVEEARAHLCPQPLSAVARGGSCHGQDLADVAVEETGVPRLVAGLKAKAGRRLAVRGRHGENAQLIGHPGFAQAEARQQRPQSRAALGCEPGPGRLILPQVERLLLPLEGAGCAYEVAVAGYEHQPGVNRRRSWTGARRSPSAAGSAS